MPSKDELAELVAAKLSLEEILDVLGWDVPDLVMAIIEDIWEDREDFMEAIK